MKQNSITLCHQKLKEYFLQQDCTQKNQETKIIFFIEFVSAQFYFNLKHSMLRFEMLEDYKGRGLQNCWRWVYAAQWRLVQFCSALQIAIVLSFLFYLYHSITAAAPSTAITSTSNILSTICCNFVTQSLVSGTTNISHSESDYPFENSMSFFTNAINIYISEETPNLSFAISQRVKYFNLP